MPFPFEVPFRTVQADLDFYVDEIFASLQSEFLMLPKGPGFIEYPVFEHGYEALKQTTNNFQNLAPKSVLRTVHKSPIAFIVLRAPHAPGTRLRNVAARKDRGVAGSNSVDRPKDPDGPAHPAKRKR